MKWVRGATVGRGSSATVSLAVADGDLVAVAKTSPLSNSSILKHEESILRDLQGCPQIISCFGHDVTVEPSGEELFNLLLEYAPGGPLSGPLPESAVRRYAHSILKGLSFIHAKGYVHCDLKPHNILIDGEGSLKIADFGLAKKMGEEPGCSFRGSPLYTSPESVAKQEYEPATDVWSLGCVVVEMLTGRPAWGDLKGEEIWGLMMKIGFGDEVPEIPTDMSEEGKEFLRRCFVRDPRKRWTADMLLKHPFVSNLKDGELGSCVESPRSVFSFENGDESSSSLLSSSSSSSSYLGSWKASDPIRVLATGNQFSWGCESCEGWIRVRGEFSSHCSSSAKDRIRDLETGELPDWCSSLLSDGWMSARSNCRDEFCKCSILNECKKY